MKFCLFSKAEFDITDPVALIECYCIQTNFYSAYDLLIPHRQIDDVAKIGARIDRGLLENIRGIVADTRDTQVFSHNLDYLLAQKADAIQACAYQASEVLKRLMNVGIGLSQATKVLHTVYPHVMPMIDSMLQEEYRRTVDSAWSQSDPGQILYAYYINLREQPNRGHLTDVYNRVAPTLPCLTKVRVFDIIWWSYLRAKKLAERTPVKLSTITAVVST